MNTLHWLSNENLSVICKCNCDNESFSLYEHQNIENDF